MSYPDVVSRVTELQALAGQVPAAPSQPDSAPSSFVAALAALAAGNTSTVAWPAATSYLSPVSYLSPSPYGGSAGARVLAEAQSQLGATEEPPGSNDGPQLAEYRGAVEGAAPGQPWCAYFASWAAARAGVPLGDDGQGLGSVSEIADWAGRTGRLLPASSTPSPGDLILYGGRHVGIVESVNPDGSLTTVEGNYANAVSQVHRSPSEATGFVRL